MKRKILYITSRSDLGGGPYHVDILITYLFDSFELFVAAPLNDPYGKKWVNKLGKENFFEIPFRSFNLIQFLKLALFVKKKSISVIHSHGKGAGVYGRLLKILLPNIKTVHTFHGFHIQEYNFFMKKIYILTERFFNILTNQFINVSLGEKKECITEKVLNESQSVVIYNALNTNYSDLEDKTKHRLQLGLDKNKFLIITIARFSYQKNLELLINIAEQLKQNQRILFLIIGDGEQKESLNELLISKQIANVQLLGAVNPVWEYLLASDIYFSSSRWEGLPFSLIEALSCGLPIIATNVTGNNEVVDNNKNGYLFELDKPGDAIQKILETEASPEAQKIMAENSIRIFKDKFQLKSMIDKTTEVYHNLYAKQKK